MWRQMLEMDMSFGLNSMTILTPKKTILHFLDGTKATNYSRKSLALIDTYCIARD